MTPRGVACMKKTVLALSLLVGLGATAALRHLSANGSYWNRYHLRAFSLIKRCQRASLLTFDIDLGNEMCESVMQVLEEMCTGRQRL
ncbi:hypothetical protein KCP70_02975 [Salmonella enterica subsp. enterica]|nr:hypothetical protein KCP70_02975 [Salmonella enterica subsp. enterica]